MLLNKRLSAVICSGKNTLVNVLLRKDDLKSLEPDGLARNSRNKALNKAFCLEIRWYRPWKGILIFKQSAFLI